jgi:secreted trypsin-like serine protease
MQVRISVISVLLSLALFSCPLSAVVIRHDVPDGAYLGRESHFPAVFSLYLTKAGHRDCLATLITPQYAITAAHCTEAKQLTTQIGIGKPGFLVQIGGREAKIIEVIRHQAMDTGFTPDVALLRLSAPILKVRPIPVMREQSEVGQLVVMPGWGRTGNGKVGLGEYDGLFRIAENRVDRAEHGKLYWKFDDPAHGTALTLEGISGPGDSGGPALIKSPDGWHIAGVSSAQRIGDGPEGIYGVEEVFVRLSDFVAWIETKTQVTDSCGRPASRYSLTVIACLERVPNKLPM